jgi:hypothetical protein
MTFTTAETSTWPNCARRLKPMSAFDPGKAARIYDNLNEIFFEWDPRRLRWARLLGWRTV